jgi:dihydroflavonol-4-reductase
LAAQHEVLPQTFPYCCNALVFQEKQTSPMSIRVLVTGARGFLGAHVSQRLLQSGARVRALVRPGQTAPHLESEGVELAEGDLLDEPSLRRACRGADALIHCAARTGYWSRQNQLQRATIVEGTAALLRAVQGSGVGRIVHVSSIATVGASANAGVLDEQHVWNARALRINYVTSKHEAEHRALAAAWAGMDLVVVNPCALIGPRLDGKPGSALVRRSASGNASWIPPGGTSIADVEDVALGVVSALERGRPGERYILGGHNISWRELDQRIASLAHVAPSRRHVPRAALPFLRAGAGVLDWMRLARPPWTPEIFRAWGWFAYVDSGKAQRELGYGFRPLEESLARTLNLPRRPGSDPSGAPSSANGS